MGRGAPADERAELKALKLKAHMRGKRLLPGTSFLFGTPIVCVWCTITLITINSAIINVFKSLSFISFIFFTL